MAYGSVNVPGVTGAELEAVRKLAQTAKDTADAAGESAGNAIPATQKGVPGGVAELDEGGHIPVSQLPETSKFEPALKAAPTKASIADGDGVVITDSQVSNATKRVLWSTIKSTLGRLFVPLTRNINGKELSADLNLTVDDVGAQPRENLLDNWDFGNLVNQRGKTTYTSKGGVFDRWKIIREDAVTTGKVDILEDSIKITVLKANNSANWDFLYQYIEDEVAKQNRGKKITISCFYDKNTIVGTGWVSVLRFGKGVDNQANGIFFARPTDGIMTATVMVPADADTVRFGIIALKDAVKVNDTIKIYGVKIETGEDQTLVIKDGENKYTMTTRAKYSQELEKCRYYFNRIKNTISIFGSGLILTANKAYIIAPLSQSIRSTATLAKATILMVGTVYLWDKDNYGASGYQATHIISATITSENNVCAIEFEISGGTPGQPILAQIRDSNSYIEISAEL